MCLAIGGKITKITGRKAYVQYPHTTQTALIGEANLQPGDYVLVQMGIIIKKLTPTETNQAVKA